MTPPRFLSFAPFPLFLRKLRRRLGMPITFRPVAPNKKRALLSYTTHPFTITAAQLLRSPHTNPWECLGIVETLLERGYTVDVIEWSNTSFVPRVAYALCIDIHTNLERLAPLLPPDCLKLFYATGAYYAYQNAAEQERLAQLATRRGFVLAPRRIVAAEHPEQVADYMTTLGNDFAASTYAAVGAAPERIPLPSVVQFPSPHEKDFDAIRTHYLFIGGGGAVHKGLDLVLEFFAAHTEYSLTVCGPYAQEEDFARAYHLELYEIPTITYTGRIDVRSDAFREIVSTTIGLIYPSCSEGQSGSVITALSAGLIPLVTHQSGVDVEPFGRTLPSASLDSIADAIQWLSSRSRDDLAQRATASWEYARAGHSYDSFTKAYDAFLERVLI